MRHISMFFATLALCLACGSALAEHIQPRGASSGQTVYIPAYSSIYHGGGTRPFLLAVTLSVRNVDPETPISIEQVRYLSGEGDQKRFYLDEPASLGPFAAREFFVEEKDTTGGLSAGFLVEWSSEKPVNPPVIESVMIGAALGQGISFTSRGVVVEEN